MGRGKIAAAVLALALASCGGGSADAGSDADDGTHDDSGLACRHFRNIAGDAAEGILTDAELREKLKEVDDNASIATPEVAAAARDMLAAATSGSGLGDAVTAMGEACADAGW